MSIALDSSTGKNMQIELFILKQCYVTERYVWLKFASALRHNGKFNNNNYYQNKITLNVEKTNRFG